MRAGDTLQLIGPAGAPFTVTVGPAFTAEYVAERLRTGEWNHPGGRRERDHHSADGGLAQEEAPSDGQPQPAPEGGPDRPGVNAAKAEWIAYVAARGLLSREDAANYTKADLIEIAD